MMKYVKRILSCLMIVTILSTAGLTTVASAATDAQTTQAKALYELGLFQGYDNSGNNFGLDDPVTREQGLVLLIRLLGEEQAAKAWTGAAPFTDVPDSNWARAYIGYAKEKGYTNGVGNNQFGLGGYTTTKQMVTFALRGLDYSADGSNPDFTFQGCMAFAVSKGILTSEQEATSFDRGDAVEILFSALGANVKSQDYDLLSKLMNQGSVTQAQYDKAMAIVNGTSTAVTGVKLDKTAVSVAVGKSVQLTGSITPAAANQNVTWSSSDSAVAKVDADGKVTGVKAGTAIITVKTVDGGKTATCKVTVTAASNTTQAVFKLWNRTDKQIDELYFAPSSDSGYGKEYLATRDFDHWSKDRYIEHTFSFNADTKYDFYVRYHDGTEYEATGLSFAKATSAGGTINLTTSKVSMVVGSKAVSSAGFVKQGSSTTVAGVKLDQTTASIQVGKTVQLTGTITPSGASQKVTWSSSNTAVATVNADGVVTGVKAGAATITVKTVDGGKTATCKVTVTASAAADTTADYQKLVTRYNKAVDRYNGLLERSGALPSSVKDTDYLTSVNQLTNAISDMKSEIKSTMTAAQIKDCNAALDVLDKAMDAMEALIDAAEQEKATSTTRTIYVDFYNNTTADFLDFAAAAKGGSGSAKQNLVSKDSIRLQFTVPNDTTPFTVTFTEGINNQPYELTFSFDSSVKDGGIISINFGVNEATGEIVYEQS